MKRHKLNLIKIDESKDEVMLSEMKKLERKKRRKLKKLTIGNAEIWTTNPAKYEPFRTDKKNSKRQRAG